MNAGAVPLSGGPFGPPHPGRRVPPVKSYARMSAQRGGATDPSEAESYRAQLLARRRASAPLTGGTKEEVTDDEATELESVATYSHTQMSARWRAVLDRSRGPASGGVIERDASDESDADDDSQITERASDAVTAPEPPVSSMRVSGPAVPSLVIARPPASIRSSASRRAFALRSRIARGRHPRWHAAAVARLAHAATEEQAHRPSHTCQRRRALAQCLKARQIALKQATRHPARLNSSSTPSCPAASG